MTAPRMLIAGIGNIFLGDDAFGVLVAQKLASRPLPEGVRVVDFGIRGMDLALATLEDYDAIVMIHAAPRGGVPGTLYLIQPDVEVESSPTDAGLPTLDMYSLDPARVLQLAQVLGGRTDHILVVGCEPFHVGNEEHDTPEGLSPPVEVAVDAAVELMEALLARWKTNSANWVDALSARQLDTLFPSPQFEFIH